MEWVYLIVAAIGLSFGLVVFFGAPYVPTLDKQTRVALDMLNLQPGQTLLELGSGDGKILKAAAERDLLAVGYEINPFLVIISRLRTWRYRKQVTVHWGNFWTAQWPPADGIFTFLLPKYMEKLDHKIEQYSENKPVKLASFAFAIPHKPTTAEKSSVYLYTYDS